MKPENPISLKTIMHAMAEVAKREKNDPVEKERLIKEARKIARYMISISKQDEPDSISWCYQFNSMLKAPHEQTKTATDTPRVNRTETVPRQRGDLDAGMRAEP